MKIAVIIIHFGQKSRTEKCLRSLSKKIGDNTLILINNTQSDVESLASLIDNSHLIDNRQNVGFAKAVNQGINLASNDKAIGGYLLLNNDLALEFGSIDQLARTFIEKKTAGIVSPVLLHSEKMYDWGGKYNPWTGMVKHTNFTERPKTILTVDHVAGAAMLIKRELVDKIGYLDERFFLYFEDLDYCLRAKNAGYTIHINPAIVGNHELSGSSKLSTRLAHQWRSHFLFTLKHIPRTARPTAILVDILLYPLWLIKSYLFGG